MPTIQLEYKRCWLYPKQLEIVDNDSKYSLILASTKSGKTYSMVIWLIEKALFNGDNRSYCWLSPTFRTSEIAFELAKKLLRNTDLKAYYQSFEMKHCIKFANGSVITFIGSDNVDSVYGAENYAAVVDEASRCKEEAFIALQSTLTFTQGPVKLIGNVTNSANWFYKWYKRAKLDNDPDVKTFLITVNDAIDAGILDKKEIDRIKKTISETSFNALYNCIATEDGTNVFGIRAIKNCIAKLSTEKPYCFGLDLAKKNDYVALIGLDRNQRVCYIERWQGNYSLTKKRVIDTVKDTPCLVDQTGVGEAIVEDLQFKCNRVEGIIYTNRSKADLIENLTVDIQNNKIRFPEGILTDELYNFEYEITKTGKIAYNASVEHDDLVNALALADLKYKQLLNRKTIDNVLIDFDNEAYNEVEEEGWIELV